MAREKKRENIKSHSLNPGGGYFTRKKEVIKIRRTKFFSLLERTEITMEKEENIGNDIQPNHNIKTTNSHQRSTKRFQRPSLISAGIFTGICLIASFIHVHPRWQSPLFIIGLVSTGFMYYFNSKAFTATKDNVITIAITLACLFVSFGHIRPESLLQKFGQVIYEKLCEGRKNDK